MVEAESIKAGTRDVSGHRGNRLGQQQNVDGPGQAPKLTKVEKRQHAAQAAWREQQQAFRQGNQGRGVCFEWRDHGGSSKGEKCNYEHPPGQKGVGKGKGKGKGKG